MSQQPDGSSEHLSSEMHVDDQKRLSRRSAFKKAIQGGVALYVAPQILCSELVWATGGVSGGPGPGGGEFVPPGGGPGPGGGEFVPPGGGPGPSGGEFVPPGGGPGPSGGGGNGGTPWWPALIPLAAIPATGGGAGPLVGAVPPVGAGAIAAGGGVPGYGDPGGIGKSPRPRTATLPPKPLKRRVQRPKRAIKGLW